MRSALTRSQRGERRATAVGARRGLYRADRRGAARRPVIVASSVLVLALAAAGCGSSSPGNGTGKVTLTEIDWYTSGGSSAAVQWYNKRFEASHPGVTVKRQVVPSTSYLPKILQQASAHDLSDIVMVDNPNVQQMAATGQLRVFNGLPGFTTKGYYPASARECLYQGKYYCYPIGDNTVGIFYNKKMLAAKHLQPPATWAQLVADAKALTTNGVHGFAFSATQDENSTFQFEPYFWSNGADLSKVNSAGSVQALTLWATMVKNGSVSKSVLQWPQFPDLYEQFAHGSAAMIENGPWILPNLASAGWKYGKQYGIVPIPVPSSGRQVVTPVGGETWALANSGGSQQQKLAWEWVQGLQRPSVMTHVTALMNYLPPKPAVAAQVAKADPAFAVFAKELETARPRTTVYGANYTKVSQAISTAIQSAVTGSASPSAALARAQATIAAIPHGTGG